MDYEKEYLMCLSTKKVTNFGNSSRYFNDLQGDFAVKCKSCGKLIYYKLNFFADTDYEEAKTGVDPVVVSPVVAIECPSCSHYNEYSESYNPTIIYISDCLTNKGYENRIVTTAPTEFNTDTVLMLDAPNNSTVWNIYNTHSLPGYWFMHRNNIEDEWVSLIGKYDGGYEASNSFDYESLDNLLNWVLELPDLTEDTIEEDE